MIHLYKIRRGGMFKYKGKAYYLPMCKQHDPLFWWVKEDDDRGKREYIDKFAFVEPL